LGWLGFVAPLERHRPLQFDAPAAFHKHNRRPFESLQELPHFFMRRSDADVRRGHAGYYGGFLDEVDGAGRPGIKQDRLLNTVLDQRSADISMSEFRELTEFAHLAENSDKPRLPLSHF